MSASHFSVLSAFCQDPWCLVLVVTTLRWAAQTEIHDTGEMHQCQQPFADPSSWRAPGTGLRADTPQLWSGSATTSCVCMKSLFFSRAGFLICKLEAIILELPGHLTQRRGSTDVFIIVVIKKHGSQRGWHLGACHPWRPESRLSWAQSPGEIQVGGCAAIFGGREWDTGRGPESRGTPSVAWAVVGERPCPLRRGSDQVGAGLEVI